MTYACSANRPGSSAADKLLETISLIAPETDDEIVVLVERLDLPCVTPRGDSRLPQSKTEIGTD